ncbi:MAG: acetate--CoA ligase [Thiohalocapsa sp.]|jgi:acetyl-CoA synthetase|uniref:acetate--CoA ligase n=1 Tax=Thiohalocapsa sp. TaxID=2497641 RepID=UPI0025EE8A95|nr:acetate--CoA ligase [Thiohalocapsa sp.]MCG6942841.1 acetate--CoA ligase [Thiohalocapsa sp.]
MHKTDHSDWPPPNLADYAAACGGFSWEAARAALAGLPGGGLNIAFEAVDRHLTDGLADKVAIRWLAKDLTHRDITYRELAALTSRFAHLLERLGVARGERVFSLLGRVPELYTAALGTLKAGRVFSPLFSAFGPEPVRSRMEIGDARVLVTSASLYRRKVAPWRDSLPGLAHVLLTDAAGDDLPAGTLSLAEALAECPDSGGLADTKPEDMALLHFTSGTTGLPKGAVHVHEAVVVHRLTGLLALDLHQDDIYWCTADPGWVTGTSYGIIAPLVLGATMVVDEAEMDPARWLMILECQQVTVWYTAPTAIRMLMKIADQEHPGIVQDTDLSHLRFLASVGEPLNPEAVVWSCDVIGLAFHDNWWQTETGGIMIANCRSLPIKPGSMGRPLPGIEAAIVERDPATGEVTVIDKPDTPGQLALRPGWPSMFRGYINEPERYAKCFAGGWYLSGDLARRDADGYFWFLGRADDMIKSAGHLIGPFEVESALMEHDAVAEAAAIGIPEPTAGEIVKALVALRPGFAADESLRRSLLAHARKRLGPAVAPREIDFRANLPKTRSGKIMRRLLRARELGLPEGDISTLESDER